MESELIAHVKIFDIVFQSIQANKKAVKTRPPVRETDFNFLFEEFLELL